MQRPITADAALLERLEVVPEKPALCGTAVPCTFRRDVFRQRNRGNENRK